MREKRAMRLALAALLGAVANWLPSVAAAAPETIALSSGQFDYRPAVHVEYLKDADGSLSFDELLAGARSDEWFYSQRDDPNFGFTSAVYWARLRIYNPSRDIVQTILSMQYPLLDDVQVHVQRADGSFEFYQLGDLASFSRRPLKSELISVPITTAPAQNQWIYVRSATTSSMQIGVELGSYAQFFEDTTYANFMRGLYYGVMLVMALYNLFLYISVRNFNYLLYVVFVVLFVLTQLSLDGGSSRYFFSNSPRLANTFTPFMVAAVQVPILLFTQRFLNTRENAPRWHIVLSVFVGLSAVGVVLSLTAPYAVSIRYAAAFAILEAVLCETVGILVWRRGFRPARFYVLAWTSFLGGTIAFVLMSFGVLPATSITRSSQRIGSASEVTLLSFALADWIKLLERQREEARAASVALDRDLQVTAAVQQMLLPKHDFVAKGGVALAGFYRPATRCGGDWWWHEALPDGRTLVLLGDVTGHGAGAAMMTAAVAAGYRSHASNGHAFDAEGILAKLDQTFRSLAGGLHQMSMSAVILDPEQGRVDLYNAGGPAVLLWRADGENAHLSARGHLLGGSQLEVGHDTATLSVGDRVLVFSDGLTELAKANGRQLGYRGVLRLLDETRGLDLVAARAHLVAALDNKRGDQPQQDDFTFVLAELRDGAVGAESAPVGQDEAGTAS